MIRALLLLAAVATCGTSFATELDGNWWRDKLDGGMRVAFIIGYLEGVDSMTVLGPMAFCQLEHKDGKDLVTCIDRVYPPFRQRALGNFAAVQYGQLRDGVDTIYQDYKNRRILVKAAIQHAAKAISGVPAEELERNLELLRKSRTP